MYLKSKHNVLGSLTEMKNGLTSLHLSNSTKQYLFICFILHFFCLLKRR